MKSKINIDKLPFQPFDVVLTDTEYSVKLRPCSRKPLSWKEELVVAASLYKQIPKPKFLAMSGGIDSEVMALSFIEAGVEFTPFILKYSVADEIINSYDISLALEFCKKYRLDPLVYEIDPNVFLDMAYDKEYFDYDEVVDIYQFVQIYIINAIEKLNGMVVLGSGIQMWRYPKDTLLLRIFSAYLNSLHYIESKNLCHWPAFFWTTPELIRSYVDTTIVKQSFSNPSSFKLKESFEKVKAELYHATFPDLVRREKFHGYELFYDRVPRYKFWIDKELERNARRYSITYEDFLKQLEPK